VTPARKPRFFRVIYYDRDAKTFNVSDIVSDDTAVTNRTFELQKVGRNVNITTTTPETDRERVPTPQVLFAGMPAGYRHDPNLRW